VPSHNIVIESAINDSFRVSSMRGMFDVPIESKLKHQWQVNIPIEDMKWNVGLIVGASGSGKTVISKHLWPIESYHSGFTWDNNKALIDEFPTAMSVRDITSILSKVGFSSPPLWAVPFNNLSNGQKFRVELARIICEPKDLTIIDEFTSVVDRTSAKIGSFAVSKTIKQLNKKVICVSCHRDIVEWLEPDWVYDVDAQHFARGELQRPKIDIKIYECDRSYWKLFRRHHYLTNDLSVASRCFIGVIENQPAVFTSFIHSAGFVGIKREHRTVVLPDFQGVGIGGRVSEWLGSYCKSKGWRFTTTFSHPSFVHQRSKSINWKIVSMGHQSSGSANAKVQSRVNSSRRLTVRAEYVGKSLDSPSAD
jgi:ABC-type polar amino acid transport system ATPase subunit